MVEVISLKNIDFPIKIYNEAKKRKNNEKVSFPRNDADNVTGKVSSQKTQIYIRIFILNIFLESIGVGLWNCPNIHILILILASSPRFL